MTRLREWLGFLFGTWTTLADGTRVKIYQPPSGMNRGDAWFTLGTGCAVLVFVVAVIVFVVWLG